MSTIDLNHVVSMNNVSVMNSNFDIIEQAVNGDIIHAQGGQNVMKQDLDLNGHRLLNVFSDPSNPNSTVKQSQLAAEAALRVAGDAASKLYTDQQVAGVVGGFGSFTQAGTGAATRTFQDKLRDVVNVFDFIPTANHAGIIAGTDLTDYSNAIQNAITQAVASKSPCIIPGGTFYLSKALQVYPGLDLRGSGRGNTILIASAGWYGPLITNTASGSPSNLLQLRDFQANGNRSVNNTGTAGSFTLVDLQQPSPGSTRVVVRDIYVTNTIGHGFQAASFNRDSVFDGITAYFCDGVGITAGTADSIWANLNAGQSGSYGIAIYYNGTFTNLKSWFSGRISAGAGYGFLINGEAPIISNAWSQDNIGGFLVNGHWAVLEGVSDSDSGLGIRFQNGAYGNSVKLKVYDRVGGLYTHSQGFRFASAGTIQNDLEITNFTAVPTQFGDGQGVQNTIRALHRQNLAATYTTPFTPNADANDVIAMTLTGNVVINAPTNPIYGAELEFRFTQDATGGRTIGFTSSFRLNWTPALAANKMDRIKFRFSGATNQWLQVDSATNL